MKVLGIRVSSFKEKETGNVVNYCQLHVCFPSENTIGESVEVVRIPYSLVEEVKRLKPNDNIIVSYNKFGKVESFRKEV